MAPTLVREPAPDTAKAPIENALELTDLSIIGPVSVGFSFCLFFPLPLSDLLTRKTPTLKHTRHWRAVVHER